MGSEIEIVKAKEVLSESARSYLTSRITIPLGNPALKNVHTNQFLWTELPSEFLLENWETIAEAYQSKETRYQGSANSGYTVNRWYVEGVNITVDASSGKAEMQLDLNAFPSSAKEYTQGYKALMDEYQNTYNKQANSGGNTSSGKNKTNAVANKDTALIKDANVKKYSIPSAVVNAVKKACKGKTSDKDKAYAWYKWMDANVGYDSYTDHLYSPEQVINRKKGNCVDNSRVFRLGCLAMGIKCNFMKGWSCCAETCAHHQWNKVYINGKGIEVDCGRTMASWGGHWGSCSGGTSETSSSW